MIPNIIVLANGKGGVGKSTLARALAGHWLLSGLKPALIDADPQASVSRRHDIEGPMREVPVHRAPDENEIVPAINELRTQFAPLIIDTAGFRNSTTILAISHSDVALIPLTPAPDDLDEALAMMALVREINQTQERLAMERPVTAALILTMTIFSTLITRQIRADINSINVPLLQAELCQRIAYREAAINGLAPNIANPDGAAARDIAAIATEISELLNTTSEANYG